MASGVASNETYTDPSDPEAGSIYDFLARYPLAALTSAVATRLSSHLPVPVPDAAVPRLLGLADFFVFTLSAGQAGRLKRASTAKSVAAAVSRERAFELVNLNNMTVLSRCIPIQAPGHLVDQD